MNTSGNTQPASGDITAIILAASNDTTVFGPEGFPTCMMPLSNKPALQHAIELAVGAGAENVHVIVSEAAELIGDFLKKGERWGVHAQTHLARNANIAYAHLSRIAAANSSDTHLILHCDTLPPALLEDVVDERNSITLFVHDGQWTGAALVRDIRIPGLRQWTWAEFNEYLTQPQHDSAVVEVDKPLFMRTGVELLESQRRILAGECTLPTQYLRTAEAGIWIGRNTRLHPTTRLHPPVMIGPNCDISAHVDIGPNVVIADHCIIDRGVTAKNSLVLDHSAVGEGLELNDVILAGQRLHNARINATIDVRDEFLLGDLSRRGFRESLSRIGSRAIAAALLLTFLPAVLLAVVVLKLRGHSPRLTEYHVVETPTVDNPGLWKSRPVHRVRSRSQKASGQPTASLMWRDLLRRVVPGCWAVARGSISLTGTSQRTETEFLQVPSYWRRDLLQTRGGLISETLVQYGPKATADESCTADMWYAMMPGRAKKIKLLARYAKALIHGPLAVRLADQTPDAPATEDETTKRTYANSREVCDVECV